MLTKHVSFFLQTSSKFIKLVMLCTEEASEEFAQIRKRKNERVSSYYTANFAYIKDLKNYSLSELLQKQHTALYMFLRSPDSRMQFLMSFLGIKS